MNEREWLAARFEDNRPHLRDVAYRMLGSVSDADDAMQEFWLRLSRSDASGVLPSRSSAPELGCPGEILHVAGDPGGC